MRAVGYTSASATAGFDGPHAQQQRDRIEQSARRLGLDLIDMVHDQVSSGARADSRPGLHHLLDRIEAGEASCLVVSDLDRLSSDIVELGDLLTRMEGHRLIVLDVELDTDTPAGALAVAPRPGAPRVPKRDDRPQPAKPAKPAKPANAAKAAKPAKPAKADEVAVTAATAASAETTTPAAPPPPAEPAVTAGVAKRALGYASVPGDDESDVSHALEEQAEAIERTCAELGLTLVEVVRERASKSGKALDRAGVSYMVERLAAGDAACLVVTGLDRLSQSVAELGKLVEWLAKSDVRLVAVDLNLDTANPGGQTAARALASVAGWEQERLSERTRKGLAAARAKRRERSSGSEPDWIAIRQRIALMRADGMTLQGIADVLNEEGMPTARGGTTWRPSSVQTAAGYKRRRRTAGVADLPPPRSRVT